MTRNKKQKKRKTTKSKSRILHLFKEINSENVEKIVTKLLELDKDRKRRSITIYVNSGGGSTDAGWALVDIMEKCKCPIKTIGVGEICSMAVPILLAGTIGRRYISKRAFIMIHSISVDASDYLEHAKSRILNAEQIEKIYDDYLLDRSNLPKKIIDNAKSKEVWLNSKECLKYGLADKEL